MRRRPLCGVWHGVSMESLSPWQQRYLPFTFLLKAASYSPQVSWCSWPAKLWCFQGPQCRLRPAHHPSPQVPDFGQQPWFSSAHQTSCPVQFEPWVASQRYYSGPPRCRCSSVATSPHSRSRFHSSPILCSSSLCSVGHGGVVPRRAVSGTKNAASPRNEPDRPTAALRLLLSGGLSRTLGLTERAHGLRLLGGRP